MSLQSYSNTRSAGNAFCFEMFAEKTTETAFLFRRTAQVVSIRSGGVLYLASCVSLFFGSDSFTENGALYLGQIAPPRNTPWLSFGSLAKVSDSTTPKFSVRMGANANQLDVVGGTEANT